MQVAGPASPTLSLIAETRWATLAAGFAREGCRAAGFEDNVAQRLALAAEEVVAAVSGVDCPVTLALDDRRFAARLRVTLPAANFDTAWLNPPTDALLHDAVPEGLGLYAAARLVDRLTVDRRESDGALLLGFEVERSYPQETPTLLPELRSVAGATVIEPDDALLALFARWAASAGHRHPELLEASGRLVDRRAAGEVLVRLALDRDGRPRGSMLWTRLSGRLAALHGPFLVGVSETERSGLATALLDATLSAVARSAVTGVVAFDPVSDLPMNAFETVGTLNAVDGVRPVMFRALQEDNGGLTWMPPGLEDFVTAASSNLCLGRDLEPSSLSGFPARGALMASHMERALRRVTLRPLLAAKDAPEVAAAQVRLFRQQGATIIRVLLSLGQPGDGAFAPGLLESGLVPRALIPDPGGDLLVLERTERTGP